MNSEHKERLELAAAWANGEWMAIAKETPPVLYGQYELLYYPLDAPSEVSLCLWRR
jgi:hypothetical protein